MSQTTPPLSSLPLIEDPRPWAFTKAELTAGLRRYTGNPTLSITDLRDGEITQQRSSMGRIRGLEVKTESRAGSQNYSFVLKEPQGINRAGTAGVGLREVSFYRIMRDHVPVHLPQLLAAHPNGDWLVLEKLPLGRRLSKWRAQDYLLATDQIAALHDRFWKLGEDLVIYTWLARPLSADLPIHKQAALYGAQRLASLSPATMLSEDQELLHLTERLVDNIEFISKQLTSLPSTLLHGDYWPGNIYVNKDSSLSVFDWEHAGIGPGVLDLVYFIKASRWYLDPLPIEDEEITRHYREQIYKANGHTWTDEEWRADWDFALLWIFLTQWIDLLASIPNSVLVTRLPQLESLWITPVRQAGSHRLK
ncbi:MAG: aminoglycoside phosphotransferase family protein [Anaerolineae bacterium]|nr:aminoglycoside phosphotransferase family protein [Anaerolineae bacterium]